MIRLQTKQLRSLFTFVTATTRKMISCANVFTWNGRKEEWHYVFSITRWITRPLWKDSRCVDVEDCFDLESHYDRPTEMLLVKVISTATRWETSCYLNGRRRLFLLYASLMMTTTFATLWFKRTLYLWANFHRKQDRIFVITHRICMQCNAMRLSVLFQQYILFNHRNSHLSNNSSLTFNSNSNYILLSNETMIHISLYPFPKIYRRLHLQMTYQTLSSSDLHTSQTSSDHGWYIRWNKTRISAKIFSTSMSPTSSDHTQLPELESTSSPKASRKA